jgi:hypothetical protein
MLDLIAFYGARAGTVAPLNIAGLPDGHVTVQGNNVICPAQCNQILIAYAMSQATAGSLTSSITITSPSLRASSLIELSNWNANGAVVAAAQIPDLNAPYNDFKESPIPLQPGEAIQCLSSVDVAAAAENIFVLLFLTDGMLSTPFRNADGSPVRIETLIFDGQAAAVINTWSPTALVPRQALRAGTYAVVGMKATGTSLIAARLVFGNQGPRPGVLGTNSPVGAAGVGSFADSVDQFQGLFRYGRMGVFGTFSHINPPQAEIICSVADAAITQHIALDVIKIA